MYEKMIKDSIEGSNFLLNFSAVLFSISIIFVPLGVWKLIELIIESFS